MHAKMRLASSEATSYKYNRPKIVAIPVYAQSLFGTFSSCDGVFSGYDQTLLAYSQNMRTELSLYMLTEMCTFNNAWKF